MGKKNLSWTLTIAIKAKKFKLTQCAVYQMEDISTLSVKGETKNSDLMTLFCEIDFYLIKDFQGLCK